MKILAPSILPIPEPPRPSVALPILIAGLVASIVLILAACLLLAREAKAHEAPTGWSFDISCCSNRDCGEVPPEWISEGPNGVTVKPTGELLSYGDTRLKQSKDERTYWCRPPGDPNPKTICVYLPVKGF